MVVSLSKARSSVLKLFFHVIFNYSSLVNGDVEGFNGMGVY